MSQVDLLSPLLTACAQENIANDIRKGIQGMGQSVNQQKWSRDGKFLHNTDIYRNGGGMQAADFCATLVSVKLKMNPLL